MQQAMATPHAAESVVEIEVVVQPLKVARTPKADAVEGALSAVRALLAVSDAASCERLLSGLRQIVDECAGENSPARTNLAAERVSHFAAAAAPLADNRAPAPVATEVVTVEAEAAAPTGLSTSAAPAALPPPPPSARTPTAAPREPMLVINAAKARLSRRPGAMLMTFANSPVAPVGRARRSSAKAAGAAAGGLSPRARGAAAAAAARRKRTTAAGGSSLAKRMAQRSAARAEATLKRSRRRSRTNSAYDVCAKMARAVSAEYEALPALRALDPERASEEHARVAAATAEMVAAIACDDINHQTTKIWSARQKALDTFAELAHAIPSCGAAWKTSEMRVAIDALKGCMCELRSAIVGSAAGALVAMARSGRDVFAAHDGAAAQAAGKAASEPRLLATLLRESGSGNSTIAKHNRQCARALVHAAQSPAWIEQLCAATRSPSPAVRESVTLVAFIVLTRWEAPILATKASALVRLITKCLGDSAPAVRQHSRACFAALEQRCAEETALTPFVERCAFFFRFRARCCVFFVSPPTHRNSFPTAAHSMRTSLDAKTLSSLGEAVLSKSLLIKS